MTATTLAPTPAALACVRDAMVTIPKVHSVDVTAAELRAFFADDHVHMALLVEADGRLAATVDRRDLASGIDGPAAVVGTLLGRTTLDSAPLAPALAELRRRGSRRLAVVDASGRLVGLLCLKRSGTGLCSDQGVESRQKERASQA